MKTIYSTITIAILLLTAVAASTTQNDGAIALKEAPHFNSSDTFATESSNYTYGGNLSVHWTAPNATLDNTERVFPVFNGEMWYIPITGVIAAPRLHNTSFPEALPPGTKKLLLEVGNTQTWEYQGVIVGNWEKA